MNGVNLFIKPIKVEMKILEKQTDFYPSYRMHIHIEVEHPTGKATYSASDIWFDVVSWNAFINNMRKDDITNTFSIALLDMSELFKLELINNGNEYIMTLQISEPETGFGTFDMILSYIIDREIYDKIKEAFIENAPELHQLKQQNQTYSTKPSSNEGDNNWCFV